MIFRLKQFSLLIVLSCIPITGFSQGSGSGNDDCRDGSQAGTVEVDFSQGPLENYLSLGNYTEEEEGSFSPNPDLSISHENQSIRIHGAGTTDTARVDGRTSGWFGRSLYINKDLEVMGTVEVSSTFIIKSQTFSSNSGSGFQADIFIEFDNNNRLYFNLHQERGQSKIVTLGFDENNDHRHDRTNFNFDINREYSLSLSFDPRTRRAIGKVDGQTLLIGTFSGTPGDIRAGLSASVRAINDQLDVEFKSLTVSGVCLGNLSGFPDCNENGFSDLSDILEGTSLDNNQDDIPDECQESQGQFSFESNDTSCIQFKVNSTEPFTGGETGFIYDSRTMRPTSVQAGVDFPGSQNDLIASLNPIQSCDEFPDFMKGVVIGWSNSIDKQLLPSGDYNLFEICFEPVNSPEGGICTSLTFQDCLGPADGFIINRLIGEDQQLLLVDGMSGEVCPPGDPFLRGDPDDSGVFDITDPLFILGCIFLGTQCTTCPDAADVNDDGKVDITDAIYHLQWRFLGHAEPASPFPGCGFDTSLDELDECVYTACD